MRDWLKAQSTFLGVPIFLAFGVALYFSLFSEPSLVTIVTVFIIGTLCAILTRKIPIIALVSFFAIGFGYAGIYTHIKNPHTIPHDTHGIEISGTITNIDYTPDKVRLYLKTNDFGNIRISTKSDNIFNLGDKISGTGGLFKPKPADIPNGFDFARWAYFDNLGATGYINDIKMTYTPESGVYNIRNHIKTTANSFLVDSLVLGYKHTLPNQHREIWATNGVAHIWSISGYHMTLVAGWLFIIFYLIFRCCPHIVRRIPARIPALMCSWLGLVTYVLISGASVSTTRAFIMTTFIMAAFILGRSAISLRIASLAFIIIVAINPFYVMHAGFQLSFAAIFGIIWLWHSVHPTLPNFKPLKYLSSAFLTAAIATVFTAPFVLAHFGRFPIYGIIGNLIFLPIFSFIIMPLVFLGAITCPIGIKFPISIAHHVYDYTFQIARNIANLPYTDFNLGYIPNFGVIIMIIGFACLIFIRNNDKFKYLIARHINIALCAIFCCTGIIICVTTPRPIFYISANHKLIGAVIDGKLKFNKTRDSSNYFAFDTWKTSNSEQNGTENNLLTKESGVYRISYPKFDIVYIQSFVPLSKNITTICSDSKVKYFASYFDIDTKKCDATIIHNGAVIYPNGDIKYVPSNRIWHNRPE